MNRSPIRALLIVQATLALVCFSAEGLCWSLGLRYPYDCPVMVFKGDFFPDFTLLIDRIFVHFHTLAFFAPGDHHFMYPPAAVLLYEPFALLPPPLRVPAFLFALGTTISVVAGLFAGALVLRGMRTNHAVFATLAGIALSYPMWFEVQRGNTEMFVWALAALGVWAAFRKRGYSAAVCFGIVGAMKLYPAVLFGLLFARRQYRQIGFGLLVLLGVSTVCLWLEYPNILLSLRETIRGLQTFQFGYVQGRVTDVISYDHSLLSMFKKTVHPSPPLLAFTSRLYLRGFALLGLLLYVFRIQKLPFANQVLTLTAAMVLFPPVSFDYTLLHLYTPLGLLLLLFWKRPSPRGVQLAIPIFALLLSPLTEIIYAGNTLEGQFKSVLLLCLFVIGLVYPMPFPDGEPLPTHKRTHLQEGKPALQA